MRIDTPSVNVEKKSNEQNIQALKSWANNISSSMEYYITSLEDKISELQTEIENLKG